MGNYSLKLDTSIILGAGTVYKGTLRGVTTVAIKTMRVEKVTNREMAKFKAEIIACRPTCLRNRKIALINQYDEHLSFDRSFVHRLWDL